jgi:uncharacterized protein DUF222/HNH endonuclease
MSGLRSALDEVAALDFAGLPDARLEEEFVELQHAKRALEAQHLRCLAEIDRRASFQADGYLSTASWLQHRFQGGAGSARDQVRTARALGDMPQTREAFESGELSQDAVRLLASAHDADPDVFCAHEPVLLEAAAHHSVGELQQVVAYWKQGLESATEEAQRRWDRRRLHVSPVLGGMVRVDGDLDSDTGETLMTALRAVLDAEARARDAEDARTPAQRRADALGEVCRQWLHRSDRPVVAGERPHVTVTIDLDTLMGGTSGTSEFDHAGPLVPQAARRWACDASITRIVFGPKSEPLDVGRKTPVVPASMRRAVMARDRRCRFPSCDHPHTWCDAHHVVHWADGGRTSLANLLLLCRRHHRLVHDGSGYRLEMMDGSARFYRPDGSVLEDRAPP